jgi:ATP-dependent helicase/DNAse subunit B
MAGVDAMLLDAFEDFTPSEFRLLKALEPHVSELIVGIDGDVVEPSQQDLFTIQRATHDRVCREMHGVEVNNLPAPLPETHSQYLAREIFWRQRPTPPSNLRANVQIVTCPDLRQEVEFVGRAVKTLLLERQVPCNRIAVVFRDLRECAQTVRAVFEECQIPVNVASAVPLEETSLASFVMSLFDACGSWSRASVLDVLTSPWFDAGKAPAKHVDQFSALARRAGIIGGEQEWNNRIRRFLERLAKKSPDGEEAYIRPLPHMRESVGSLLACLETLASAFAHLPNRATPLTFVDGLLAALDQCGSKQFVAGRLLGPNRERDQTAWRALVVALGRVDAWYQREGGNDPVGRDEFVRMLRVAFRETELELQKVGGGIWCKRVEDVRHDSFEYVFLCGLNEGEFPRPPAVGAIYTDDDIAEFAELKIELDDKNRHAAREMLLFYHAVRAAETHLVMTWHTQSREGRAASPSPFLSDALELLDPLGVKPVVPDAPIFAPDPAAVASMRDLRNAAFLRNNGLREQFALEFQHATDASRIESARQDASAFGPYDGVLSEREFIDAIAEHFSPNHQFSVNQLESYAGCPFRFFMTRILGVVLEEEPGVEFDPLVRGRILHDVLQAFHGEYARRPVTDIPEPEARDAMQRHLDEAFARLAFHSINTPPKAALVERARMTVLLNRYLAIERKESNEPWAPSHFEVSFGNVRGKSEDPLSTPVPFVLATGQGPVRFSGRIDRIDTLEVRARIIDYKTSVYAKPADIDAGVSIQLPLYALALEEHLMPGTRCAEALFLQIGGKTRLSGLENRKSTWEERKEVIRNQIAAHVAHIRSAQFPPVPYRDICRECQEHRACRYESSRIERKSGAKE